MTTARARRDDLIIRRLDGEVVVFDSRTDEAHRLDQATAAVWDACDGARDCESLMATCDLTAEQVEHALVALDAAGLLESAPGLSRRGMLRAGAVAGGAVVALPVLSSIIAPTAAAAVSPHGPPSGGGAGSGSTTTPPPGSVDYTTLEAGDTDDGYFVGTVAPSQVQRDAAVFPVGSTGLLTGVAVNVTYYSGTSHSGLLRASVCVDTPSGPGAVLRTAAFPSTSLPDFTFSGSGEFVTVYYTFSPPLPVTSGDEYILELSVDSSDTVDLWEVPSTTNAYPFFVSFDDGATYTQDNGLGYPQLATYVQ